MSYSAGEREEALNLRLEFEWVLQEEVRCVLRRLQAVVGECLERFASRSDKLVLTSQPDLLRCSVTLSGDSVTHADVAFKVVRHGHQPAVCRTQVLQENPWRLQQIRDAANHLRQAKAHVDDVDAHRAFRSADEVLHLADSLLGALQRARSALVTPKKRAIEELMNSRNTKSLTPNLPEDLVLSIFVQSHKLVAVGYHLVSAHGTVRVENTRADCPVPWLGEALWLLTSALQTCQQLKDKVSVFSQYKDFTLGSRAASTVLTE